MTSKTTSLKNLLLRAWRERWTDLQWGINIKTILPRGVSGDVYNLADCILQQALVGPGPNLLVLSYLRHSLSSQLVSYAAVLQRISKYDGFHKPYCIMILLEFLETIKGGITCRGKPEEGALATSILAIVQWLLTCMHQTLTNLAIPESKMLLNGPIDQNDLFLEKPANLIKDILRSDFLSAMLYLAKYENQDTYNNMIKKCQELQTLLNSSNNSQNTIVQESLRMLSKDFNEHSTENLDTEPVTYCLQPLLTVNVLLNPTSDTSVFVNQLLMIQRLKGYSTPRLYAEIMRACFISLNDVLGTSEVSQWGAFTFFKVPHIIKQLHYTKRTTEYENETQAKGEMGKNKIKISATFNGNGNGNENKDEIQHLPHNSEYSQDVIDAFEILLQHMPLLDITDTQCSCNSIERLLNEFHKHKLVTETQVSHFAAQREGMAPLERSDHNNSPSNNTVILLLRAETTLARVLKTLDADYNKIQEGIVSVLCQVLTGKSFEIILSVATVQGQLPAFVSKLLKFNEYSKQISGETPKLAHNRAVLFDVSFLMLCSIVHTYGSEVVLSAKGGDTFFEQWVRECMVERGRPKSPEQILQHSDPAKVEALLVQFNSQDFDFKNNQVKWYEICLNIPAIMKDVLIAWENGSLTANDVKRILDAMRSRMCCFPVCAAAWLCSYMQILHQDALLKPMNMVQQFLTSPTNNEESSQVEFFKERSSLMCQIIRKMQYAVHPPTQSNASVAVMTLTHNLLSTQPVSEQLSKVWASVQHRGWINMESAHSFESFLNTGGSRWFVSRVLHEILKFRYVEELDLAVDLAFGVFHLDIEKCTLSLLTDLMPHFLQNRLTNEDLVEPQVSALAKLCAYCIFATLEFQNNPSNPNQTTSRKRSRRDMEGDDLDTICPTNKIMKLTNGENTNGIAYSTPNGLPNDIMASCRTNNIKQNLTMKEPLLSALTEIFSMFSIVAARDGEVSQETCFICRFLEHAVLCGRERTRLVLQAMPTNLVPSMLKSLPHMFKNDLLLKLYDIETVQGRKETARDLCMLRNMNLKALSRTIR